MVIPTWLPSTTWRVYHPGSEHLQSHNKIQIFLPRTWVEPPRITHINGLLDRDDIRSATSRLFGYGAELPTAQFDNIYDGRDCWRESQRVRDVFAIASTVYQESMRPHFKLVEDMKSHLWDHLLKLRGCTGADAWIKGTQLTYDARWLTDTSFLLKNWVVLHRVLGDGLSQVGKFDLLLWLSAMAFGGKIDKSMLYIMAGFAILPELRHNHLPSASSFHLDRGVKPKAHEISQALLSAYKPINHCPRKLAPTTAWGSKRRIPTAQKQSVSEESIGCYKHPGRGHDGAVAMSSFGGPG